MGRVSDLGLMLPNTEWRAWTDDEVGLVLTLQPKVLLVPLYESGIPTSPVRRTQLASIVAHLGNVRVLYRMMADRPHSFDPIAWAKESAQRYLDQAPVPGEIVGGNEWNLDGEGGSTDWAAGIAWWKAYLTELRKDAWRVPLHLAALSPTGPYLDGYRAIAGDGQLLGLVDVVDVHAYGSTYAGTIGDVAGIIGDRKPLSCTEVNGIAPSLTGDSRLRERVWFLLHSDDSSFAADCLLGSSYQDDFRRATVAGGNVDTQSKFSVGPGISAKMRDENDTAVSNEHYIGDFMSLAFGTKGLYVYSKEANQTFFLPAR